MTFGYPMAICRDCQRVATSYGYRVVRAPRPLHAIICVGAALIGWLLAAAFGIDPSWPIGLIAAATAVAVIWIVD